MPRSKSRSTPAFAALAAALALATAPALAADTFSRTVFFGDSLTDAGYFRPLLVQQNPQAAILGMHKIQERPVVINGQVVVRPMMYVALTYDHRIVDGREAVQFLVRIKDFLEDPESLLLAS